MTHTHEGQPNEAQPSALVDQQVSDKASILAGLARIQGTASDHFDAIPAEAFVSAAGEAWSAAQQLDHLNRSTMGVAQSLTLPQELLHKRFGMAEAPSSTYAELQARYLAIVHLADGKQPDERFAPAQPEPSLNAAEHKQALLQAWHTSMGALLAGAEGWAEADLDRSMLPHPLLGKLTIREMLFFTLYHTAHHISGGED